MTRGIRILPEVAIVLSQCTRLTDAYRSTDGGTDMMLIEIPRLHSCSAVKIDWHYTQNYENPHTGSYCQASVHIPNVSFIHKQSLNTWNYSNDFGYYSVVPFSNNASILPMGICSCSSPVPLLAPTLKSGGARAPPGYMAPAPLLAPTSSQCLQQVPVPALCNVTVCVLTTLCLARRWHTNKRVISLYVRALLLPKLSWDSCRHVLFDVNQTSRVSSAPWRGVDSASYRYFLFSLTCLLQYIGCRPSLCHN